MQTFTHQGKQYALINGKEYYLVRGYRTGDNWKSDWIFIQVYGKVPLHPEDLPTGEWEIIKTKSRAEYSIFTAYLPKFFDYRSLKDDQYKRLYFIGMTEQGSLFIALNFLRDHYKLKIKDSQFEKVLKTLPEGSNWQLYLSSSINQITDQGNAQAPAYSIEFDKWKMNGGKAEKLFNL
jgi:hypothetical protein